MAKKDKQKKVKIFCTTCAKRTNHNLPSEEGFTNLEELKLIATGGFKCKKCDTVNGICTLIKTDIPSFRRYSQEILWIEFGDDNKFKAKHDKVAVGRSLLMSPFNAYFTWQTTLVTEVIEEREGYVKFQTSNTLYELYYE